MAERDQKTKSGWIPTVDEATSTVALGFILGLVIFVIRHTWCGVGP